MKTSYLKHHGDYTYFVFVENGQCHTYEDKECRHFICGNAHIESYAGAKFFPATTEDRSRICERLERWIGYLKNYLASYTWAKSVSVNRRASDKEKEQAKNLNEEKQEYRRNCERDIKKLSAELERLKSH